MVSLLEQFTKVFANDDVRLLFTLIAPDCHWSIMATGEHFHGLDEIRSLVDQVQKARGHSDDAKVEIKDAFGTDDYLCVEFRHRGVVTEGFASDAGKPTEGSIFEMDFCATAQVRDGKIVRIREYFDHTHFTIPPEHRVKFFTQPE